MLYSDGRMVNRQGCRYAAEYAPLSLIEPDSRTAGQPDISADIPSESLPDIAPDSIEVYIKSLA